MAWILLLLAGVLEIGFAIMMKLCDGFTDLLPSIGAVVFGASSLVLLTLAVKTLPIGTAYAIWTGVGAAGTAAIGMLALGEPADAARLACLTVAIGGVIGLSLFGAH
ncbi:MAG: quaternary ammonium compound-resistance protein SugE [Thermoleophilaceae bacterium]|jgi:quaternary ammonium compound-resistance protein SugE|nr:quaternary ammonium compound-resistance protein SugE [Thermoleophilaceae bacterium]